MRTESDLQAHLIKYGRALGLLVYKWTSPGRRGVPDLLVFSQDGEVSCIEVKSPTRRGRLTELQRREHERLREKGVYVYVIEDVGIGEELLDLLSVR